MTDFDAKMLVKLLKERTISSVTSPTSDCVEVIFDDGSIVSVREVRIGIPFRSPETAGRFTNPFDRPEETKEAGSTPACLGGNSCHPEAPDMFPGSGV